MKFLASYTFVGNRNGKTRPRRVNVAAASIVPLDAEAEALPLARRLNAVRAIVLGEIAGEVRRETHDRIADDFPDGGAR